MRFFRPSPPHSQTECSALGRQVCLTVPKKGSQVYVEGKLETNKWQDQNGIVKAEGGSNIKRGYIDLMKNFKNNISIGVNHD